MEPKDLKRMMLSFNEQHKLTAAKVIEDIEEDWITLIVFMESIIDAHKCGFCKCYPEYLRDMFYHYIGYYKNRWGDFIQ